MTKFSFENTFILWRYVAKIPESTFMKQNNFKRHKCFGSLKYKFWHLAFTKLTPGHGLVLGTKIKVYSVIGLFQQVESYLFLLMYFLSYLPLSFVNVSVTFFISEYLKVFSLYFWCSLSPPPSLWLSFSFYFSFSLPIPFSHSLSPLTFLPFFLTVFLPNLYIFSIT